MRRFLLSVTFALCAAAAFSGDGRKPNIIFILADDLGYGDLSCQGATHVQTPNIDRLAKEGMRFKNYYSGSTVCAPSRCVLMTGFHTGHAYIRGNGHSNLRPSDVTVAEVLKKGGYRTGVFGKWGLGSHDSTGIPERKGFDEFVGYLEHVHAHNFYPTFLMKNSERLPLRNKVPDEGKLGQGTATEKVDYSQDIIARETLNFIDKHKDAPFFIYAAYTLPHANNEAGNKGMEIPDLGEFKDKDWPEPQKGLAAMIQRLDKDVGAILDRLKQHNIDNDTIVFFSSDNGPHHEGGVKEGYFKSNGPFKGYKRALYDGGIHVPFLVRWPGKIAAGSESEHLGYFPDFLPTAAEFAGEKAPENLDGISIVPTLLGKGEQKRHEYLYWEFYEQGGRQAIRMGDWKAVVHRGKPLELYDLSKDPGETTDVSAHYPEVVPKINAAIAKAHVPSAEWKWPAPRK